MRRFLIQSIAASLAFSASTSWGQEAPNGRDTNESRVATENLSEQRSSTARNPARFGGPNSVEETLSEDREDVARSRFERWKRWKEGIYEHYGLKFSFEYNALGQGYSNSAAGDDWSASGNARFFGSWTLVGKDGPNHGSLVFRVDNRHRYTRLAPQDAGIVAGSVLPTGSMFSGREWGLVNLQWSQAILEGRGGFVVGFTPADDYFHAYALASPLTAFSNLAFSVGGEVAIPDTGLGIAAGTMLGEHWYWKGGIHDANGDSTNPSFDVFHDWEFYKNLEIGWTSGQEKLFVNNLHIGVWHADERNAAGVPESWGIVGNVSWYIEEYRLLPFLRGGWSDGDAALLDGQVAFGAGKRFRDRDLGGIGIAWGSPSDTELRDQWTTEIFYRFQHGNLALTPSIQWIAHPARKPAEEQLFVASLRARVVF
jgi:porin